MQKIFFWSFLALLGSLLLINPSFANDKTTVSSWEIKTLRENLENKRNESLQLLSQTKNALEKEIGEMSKIQDITLFKATTCLGVFEDQSEKYDLESMIKQKRNEILDQYIQLNADIQRLEYQLIQDPRSLQDQIQNFSLDHEKALNNRQKSYQTEIKAIIQDFLKYVENNQELLNSLATKMDAIFAFEHSIEQAKESFHDFEVLLAKSSKLLPSIQSATEKEQKSFQQLIENSWEKYFSANPNLDPILKTRILEEKTRIQTNFDKQAEILGYQFFSIIFSYKDYLDLLEKEIYLQENFYKTDKLTLDCQKLLVSKKDLNLTLKSTDTVAATLSKGLNAFTQKAAEKEISFQIFVDPVLAEYQKAIKKQSNTLLQSFENILKQETQNQVVQGTNQDPLTTIIFNQAFNKNSYHEQIKILQNYLKNWGYYLGEINGIYDQTTINAVYQFQLKEGILTGLEKDKSGYGRFGPATRNKVNQKIAQI